MLKKQSEAIHLIVTVLVAQGKEQEFQDFVNRDATESRKEEGCIRFDVMRDKENQRKWYIYEIYRDAQAFEAH